MNGGPKKSRVIRDPKDRHALKRGWRKNPEFNGGEDVEDESLEDTEQCLICAGKIVYASKSPCNHTTCHVCTFRQRALYLKNQCLVCRTENDVVIFTEQLKSDYGDFSFADIIERNEKYKIDFTSDPVRDATLSLLDIKCHCGKEFKNFKQLSEHAKQEHNKYFCSLCFKFKKAFVCELEMYTHKQLENHQTRGDREGFKGHPECKHCKGKRFYSEDELNIHIRDKHERCHICDQHNPKTADYYKNYDELYQHFKQCHYVCTAPICLEKKFVVFRDDLELAAHMLKEHGGLTGFNNKVVVGSSPSHFGSHLSTFNRLNASRQTQANDSAPRESDSLQTKKMRFEERAKHYLNYDKTKIENFTGINNDFKSGRIDAAALLRKYSELFDRRNKSEIDILVFEFSQLFPKDPEKRKQLNNISKDILTILLAENFPILGGRSALPTTGDFHSWGDTQNSQGVGSTLERFPALSKPKKTSPQINPNQPIRYTKVLKKPGNTFSPIRVSTAQAEPSYRPTYLNNVKKNSPPASSSSSLSRNSLGPGKPSSLSEDKFPALEKKTTKKKFPRVNPLDLSSSQWSSSSESVTSSQNEQKKEEENEILDRRKQKQKKRQERVLLKSL